MASKWKREPFLLIRIVTRREIWCIIIEFQFWRNNEKKQKFNPQNFFSRERKKNQENLTVEKPCKGWSLQIISERNHNLSKTREKKRKIGKTTSGNFFFYFHICFFRDLWRQKLHVQCASTSFYIEKKSKKNEKKKKKNMENVFNNDI